MRNSFRFLGAAVLVITGCVALPITELAPVEPQANGPGGKLVVYSAREQHSSGEVIYAPHTCYSLYSSDGHHLRDVRNHIGDWDDSPEEVSLAPGRYIVVAESEKEGRVRVPIRIAAGHSTVVDLQGRRR